MNRLIRPGLILLVAMLMAVVSLTAQAASISGTVTRTSSTSPVEGLTVTAYTFGTWSYASSANITADGNYEITGLFPGDYLISVDTSQTTDMPAYYSETGTAFNTSDATPVLTLDDTAAVAGINLSLTEGQASISGTITRNDSPTTNQISVDVYEGNPCNDAWNRIKTTVTTNGQYALNGLPPGTDFFILVGNQSAGFPGSFFYTPQGNLSIDCSQATTFNLEADATLTDTTIKEATGVVQGKVLKTDDTPAAGVSLNITAVSNSTWRHMGTAYTDDSGAYTFTHLPDATYEVQLGYNESYISSDERTAQIAEGNPTQVDPIYATQAATISGSFSPDTSNLLIEVHEGTPCSTNWNQVAGIDTGVAMPLTLGQYELKGLPPETNLFIKVINQGTGMNAPFYVTDNGSLSLDCSLAKVFYIGEGEADTANITIEEFTGSIQGTVVAHDNTGVEGAQVTLYAVINSTRWNMGTTQTEADGTYTFTNLPDAMYEVQLGYNESYISSDERTAQVTEGNSTTVDPIYAIQAATISGTISPDTSNLLIEVHEGTPCSTNWNPVAGTDTGMVVPPTPGQYELKGLPPETSLFIKVTTLDTVIDAPFYVTEDGSLSLDCTQAEVFNIGEGATGTANITIEEFNGSIQGTVETLGNTQTEGISLDVFAVIGFNRWFMGTTQTDQNGTYTFSNLPDASYEIQLSDNGAYISTGAQSVQITGGGAAQVTPILATQAASISGTITQDNSPAAEAIAIVVYEGNPCNNTWSHIRTTYASSGSFVLNGLPPGTPLYIQVFNQSSGMTATLYLIDNGLLSLDCSQAKIFTLEEGEDQSGIAIELPTGNVQGTVSEKYGSTVDGIITLDIYAVVDSNRWSMGTTQTDGDGNYTFASLPDATYEVELSTDNAYVSTDKRVVQVTNGTSEPVETIHVTLGASISGTITKNGILSPDQIWMEVYEGDACTYSWNQIKSTWTDNGRYTLDGLPHQTDLFIKVSNHSSGNYTSLFYTNGGTLSFDCNQAQNFNFNEEDAPLTDTTITLPTGEIQGTIVDKNNAPLPNVTLEIFAVTGDEQQHMGMVQTDGTGTYTLASLPDATYEIRFAQHEPYVTSDEHTATVANGGLTTVNPIRATLGASISGTVTLNDVPVTHELWVNIYDGAPCAENWTPIKSAWTTNGHYTLNGLPHDTDLFIKVSSYNYGNGSSLYHPNAGPLSIDCSQSRIFNLAEGAAPLTDITIQVPTGAIQGHISDQNNDPAGEILVDISIVNGNQHWYVGTTQTNENGDYTFGPLPDATYKVNINSSEPYFTEGECIVEVTGGSLASADTIQILPGATISGTIIPNNAIVTSWVQVEVFTGDPCDDWDYIKSIGTQPGEYSLTGLPPGVPLFVRVSNYDSGNYAPGLYTTDNTLSLDCSNTREFTLQAGQTITDADIILEEATGSIQGTILDRASNSPVVDVKVAVSSDHGLVYQEALINDDGSFSVDQLPAGDLELQITPEVSTRLVFQEVDFSLDDGQEKNIGTIALEQGHQVSGTIISIAGNPVQGSEIEFDGIYSTPWTRTDPEGSFKLIFKPGRYVLALEDWQLNDNEYFVPRVFDVTNEDQNLGVLQLVEKTDNLKVEGTITGTPDEHFDIDLFSTPFTKANIGVMWEISSAELEDLDGNAFTLYGDPDSTEHTLITFAGSKENGLETATVVDTQTITGLPSSGNTLTYASTGHTVTGKVLQNGKGYGDFVTLWNGETFVAWSDLSGEGDYAFHFIQNGSYTLYFVGTEYPEGVSSEPFTVDGGFYTVPDFDPSTGTTPTHYTITASAGPGGTIVPAGNVTIEKGASQSFTIAPVPGYELTDVKVDNVSVGAVTTYPFDDVTASHTITANFAQIVPSFEVTLEQAPNGTISCSESLTVEVGDSRTFTVIPDATYKTLWLKANGEVITPDENSYTVDNITQDLIITAAFAQKKHIITASAEPNGTIEPNGDILVTEGSNNTFTVTPAPGYEVDTFLIDGIEASLTDNTYTFENVTDTHTLSVTFKVQTFLVTLVQAPYGIITCNYPDLDNVPYGSELTFTASPAPGYETFWVKVNNNEITGDETTYTLPLPGITKDTIITANFTCMEQAAILDHSSLPTTPFNPEKTAINIKVSGNIVGYMYGLDGVTEMEIPGTPDISVSAGELDDGIHTLRVRGISECGAIESIPSEVSFTVDTIPPVAKLIEPPKALTNEENLYSEVGGDGVVAYTYKLDGGPETSEIPQSTPIDVQDLKDGQYQLELFGIDTAGNKQTRATVFTWIVDTEKPEVELLNAPAHNSTTGNTTFTIQVKDEGLVSYSYKIGQEGEFGPTQPATKPISLTLTERDDPYTLYVKGVDTTGNRQSTPTERSWTVNTTVPTAKLSSLPSLLTNKTDATIQVSGEGIIAYKYSLDVNEVPEGYGTPVEDPITLSDSDLNHGSHTLYVVAQGENDNWQEAPTTYTWTVDTEAPDFTSGEFTCVVSTPATTSLDLSWTVPDDENGLSHYKLWYAAAIDPGSPDTEWEEDTAIYCDITPALSGTEHFTLTGLLPGNEYRVSILAVDEAGNESDIAFFGETSTESYLPRIESVAFGEGVTSVNNGSIRTLTLTGEYFTGETDIVRFVAGDRAFDLPCEIGKSGKETLTVMVPKGTPVGSYKFKVIGQNGISALSASNLTITEAQEPQPVITGLSPAMLTDRCVEQKFTITGNHFPLDKPIGIVIEGVGIGPVEVSDAQTIEVTLRSCPTAGLYAIQVQETATQKILTTSTAKLEIYTPITLTTGEPDTPTGTTSTSTGVTMPEEGDENEGIVPIPLTLTTDEDESAPAVSANPAEIAARFEPGTEISLEDGTPYTGTIDPPRQVVVPEAMDLEPNAVVFTLGHPTQKLELGEGQVIFVTLDAVIPNGDEAPSILYYNPEDKSLTPAGVEVTRDGVLFEQGGRVLAERENSPEVGLRTITYGLYLDHMSTYVAGTVKSPEEPVVEPEGNTGSVITDPVTNHDSNPSATTAGGGGSGGGCFIQATGTPTPGVLSRLGLLAMACFSVGTLVAIRRVR